MWYVKMINNKLYALYFMINYIKILYANKEDYIIRYK